MPPSNDRYILNCLFFITHSILTRFSILTSVFFPPYPDLLPPKNSTSSYPFSFLPDLKPLAHPSSIFGMLWKQDETSFRKLPACVPVGAQPKPRAEKKKTISCYTYLLSMLQEPVVYRGPSGLGDPKKEKHMKNKASALPPTHPKQRNPGTIGRPPLRKNFGLHPESSFFFRASPPGCCFSLTGCFHPIVKLND